MEIDLLPFTQQCGASLVQDDMKAYLKADLLETLLQWVFKLWLATTRRTVERILNEKNSLSKNLY